MFDKCVTKDCKGCVTKNFPDNLALQSSAEFYNLSFFVRLIRGPRDPRVSLRNFAVRFYTPLASYVWLVLAAKVPWNADAVSARLRYANVLQSARTSSSSRRLVLVVFDLYLKGRRTFSDGKTMLDCLAQTLMCLFNCEFPQHILISMFRQMQLQYDYFLWEFSRKFLAWYQ